MSKDLESQRKEIREAARKAGYDVSDPEATPTDAMLDAVRAAITRCEADLARASQMFDEGELSMSTFANIHAQLNSQLKKARQILAQATTGPTINPTDELLDAINAGEVDTVITWDSKSNSPKTHKLPTQDND